MFALYFFVICLTELTFSITVSPVSVAAKGIISATKGLSLRFPRFIRTREDKIVSQASTPEFLANMWRNQRGEAKQEDDDGDGLIDIDYESVVESEDCESEI